MKKIGSKILIGFFVAGLIPMIAVSMISLNTAKVSLQSSTIEKLEAVRDTKKANIESYINSISDQLQVLSRNEMVIDSLEGFSLNYTDFGASSDGMEEPDESELLAQKERLKIYWQEQFGKEYFSQTGKEFDLAKFNLNDQAIRLQYAFIANNPNPIGSKNKLSELDGGGRYGYNKYHYIIHDWFNHYLKQFGFYDIFLIDNKGHVVYSVFKELDFATSLVNGPWKESGLASAFNQSKELSNGQVYFTDLAPYQPSFNAPAAFASTPIFKKTRGGKEVRIGSLIIQMPLERITQVMSNRSGLGETGETYLVGADNLMRSDLLSEPKSHSVLNSFKNPNSGQLQTSAISKALQGITGSETVERLGHKVLSSFTDFNFGEHRWAILAEMDTEEAFGAVNQLQNTILLIVLIAILLIIITALRFAKSISQPIINLTTAIQGIKQRFDFSERAPIKSNDEIGQAAMAFNEMLESTENALLGANNTMQAIASGEFTARLNEELYGDLAILKESVNTSAASVDSTMQSLCTIMNAITSGDFKLRMDNSVQGDFRDKVNSAMETLDTVISQVGDTISKFNQGDFSGRVTATLNGDLLQLKENTNASMQHLQQAIEEISSTLLLQSEGDLTACIETDMLGELNTLKQAINQSNQSLNEVIRQVITATNTVNTASNEVSSGSSNLNNRTQQQAASLEETAASMEELTVTIKQNTDNARTADNLARDARQQAEEGRHIMDETEQAIAKIYSSSKEIEEITGLIDSIAFQTNLLALNAAVEAARAGEHGRGFAVVAGEVRSLAGKSADAAKQIKELIENTVSNIENGNNKIERTGQALTQINTSILKVSDIVAEISIASQEQQQGIQLVNEAIEQIDQGTQQNAALVEETSAAAKALSIESANLQNSVSTFKTKPVQEKSNGLKLI